MIIRTTKNESLTYLFILFCIGVIICRHRFSSEIGEVVLVMETVIILIALLLSPKCERTSSKLFYTYSFFIIYRIALSMFFGGTFDSEVKRIIYREMCVFIIIFLLNTKDTSEKMILIMRDFGVINVVLGLVEALLHKSVFVPLFSDESMIFMKYAMGTSSWRVRTCFVHPIVCAVFITVTWIILLYIPYKVQTVNYVIVIAMFLCLLATKSRSSWISFIIINIAFVIKRASKTLSFSRESVYWIILLVVISVVVGAIFFDKLKVLYDSVISRWVMGMDYQNAGNYNRVSMIKLGMADWKSSALFNKIFGHGPEYAISLLRKHSIRGWNLAVDNSYITALLNYGMIGVGILITVLIGSIYKFIRTQSNEVEMAALAVISILISGFFYDIYGWFTVSICLSIFLIDQQTGFV